MANTAEKAKVAEEKAPEQGKKEVKEARKPAPVVRARNRGQVSEALERFADAYRERYPERDVRYVYDPTHKPELSGVMGREAMGYQLVTYGEAGLVTDRNKEEQTVRVGDLVLMSISKKEKKALRDERTKWAREKTESVQREFYDAVEGAARESTPSHHSGPAARPLGRAKIEEREFSYDIEQREE